MKKILLISNLAVLLLASCATQQKWVSDYQDDVYANPAEVRKEVARLAETEKQRNEAFIKRTNDSIAAIRKAQKEKDDANPYYQDREFKYDDYYDYEYATRLKRFNSPINGISYYDNYYTNSYWYNQNPYNYGVSVYNGYSWWGSSYNLYSYNPSVNFYSNFGWGCSNGFAYNGYNPYMAGYMQGYNNGFINGNFGNYYGYGHPLSYNSPFVYGYPAFGFVPGLGYYHQPYNNGWSYYNSYDQNSSYTYASRSSHSGGNSRRTSNTGIVERRGGANYENLIETVSNQQMQTIKFSDRNPHRENADVKPVRVFNPSNSMEAGDIETPQNNRGTIRPSKTVNNDVRVIDNDRPVRQNTNKNYDASPNQVLDQFKNDNAEKQAPVRQNTIKNAEPYRQSIQTTPIFDSPKHSESAPSINNHRNNDASPSGNGGGRRPR